MDLGVKIAGIDFNNPVIAASGTFGFGREYSGYVDINRLGGVATKAVTIKKRAGNKPPRTAETYGGMLNSIGLQNPGVDSFIKEELPFLQKYDTKIIVNVAGSEIDDYVQVVSRLSGTGIHAVELNLSCPNVKEGCIVFGSTAEGIKKVVGAVRKVCRVPLIVKLSPNTSDIVSLAKAACEAGADALSLINTLVGMAIDIHTRRPILGNNTGGLSGPAIKPVAVRMTYEVCQNVSVPVIGMGGIMTGDDAIEFILAGATAVMIGTASFVNHSACIDIIDGIKAYIERYKLESLEEIRGKLTLN